MLAALLALGFALAATATPQKIAPGSKPPPLATSGLKVLTAQPAPAASLRSRAARLSVKRPPPLSAATRLALLQQAGAALSQPLSAAAVALPANLVVSPLQPTAPGVRIGYEGATLDYSGADLPSPDLASIWASHKSSERGAVVIEAFGVSTPALVDCRFANDSSAVSFIAQFGGKRVAGPLQYGHAIFVIPTAVYATIELATPSANFHFPVPFIDCTFTPLN